MSVNEQQGRWLLENRVLTREQLTYAWSQSSAYLDLCDTLQALKMLTPEQAAYTRAQCASGSVPSHPSSPSSDALLTVVPQSPPSSSASAADSNPSSASGLSFGPFEHPDYDIERELGRGGMGVVYLARNKESGALFVIKVISAKRADVTGVSRFQREAKALIKLQHQNIVAVQDYGESQGQPYFVMDFVEGTDLLHFVNEKRRAGALEEDTVAKIFQALAEALIYCHAQGMVHRDLKPANILIEAQSLRPVVLDFGLVSRLENEEGKPLDGDGEHLTKTGQTLGTPAYMPPEQLDMKGEFGAVTTKSDVWGFGATLFFALTGEPPIKGATPMNIYKALMTEKIRPPSSVSPGIAPWLDELCLACLQKESAKRPTMEQVLKGLRSKKAGLFFPKAKSNKGRILGALVLCSALAAAFFFLWLGRDSTPPVLQIAKNLRPALKTGFYSQRSRVLIQGRLQDENPSHIRIESLGDFPFDESVQTEGPRFKKALDLPEGSHKFSIQGFDSAENPSEAVTLTIIVDKTPPRISFARVDPKRDIRDDAFILRGRVSEPKCELSTELDKIPVQGQTFEYRIRKSKPWGDLRVFAKDAAGNVSQAVYRQYLVRTKGPRSHGELSGAIAQSVSGSLIFLGPGSHSAPVVIEKDIDIEGLGKRDEIQIFGKAGAGDLFVVKDARLGLKNVSLGHQNRTVKAAIVRIDGGQVHIENSLIVISGSHGIRALERSPETRAPSSISLKGCVIRREDRRNLDADLISLRKGIGRFEDIRVVDEGRGLLDRRRPSLIDGRLGSSLWIQGMSFKKWKGRGVFQRGGVGFYRNLSFTDHGDYGIEFLSGLSFLDGIQVKRTIAHGLLFQAGSRAFLSNSKIQGCERLSASFEGEEKETAYKSGVYVTWSRLLVKKTVFQGNQGFGVRVSPAKDKARAAVAACQFKENGLGPSNRLRSVSRVTVEADGKGPKTLDELLRNPSGELGVVYRLKPGRYKLSATLPMGITLVGVGKPGDVILEPKSGALFRLEHSILGLENLTLRSKKAEPLLSISQGSGVRLTDCVIDGPLLCAPVPGKYVIAEKRVQGARPYLEMNGCEWKWGAVNQVFQGVEGRLRACRLRSSKAGSLTLGGSCHFRLKSCELRGASLKLGGASVLVAEACQFVKSPGSGVMAEDSYGEFRDCAFLEAEKIGVVFEGSRGLFESCRFAGCGESGLSLSGSRGRFRACQFGENGDHGLLVNDGSSVLLEGVEFSKSGRGRLGLRKPGAVIFRELKLGR